MLNYKVLSRRFLLVQTKMYWPLKVRTYSQALFQARFVPKVLDSTAASDRRLRESPCGSRKEPNH